MALREIVLGSDNQRLLRAATAALLAHSLLFAFGFWTISQFSVPSDVNRGIVITLDKALREGLKAPDAPALDTINDAQVGAPESLRPRFEPSELSQLNDTPMAKPAAEIRLPAAATPSAEISETSEVSPATSVLESAPPTTVHTANLSDAPGDTAPDLATEIAAGAQTQPIEAPVLTKATGELTISSAQPTPHPETASEVSMTQRQKRMLDKKLKKWAEKIDDLEEAPEAVSWRHRGQTYVAKFSRLPASGEMAMDKMVVEVTTEQDGQRLTTTMKMKQLAFSNFAQFVHRWDPELLLHDDELEGRFHSNSRIELDFDHDAKPIFHGKVTTASSRVGFEQVAYRATRKQIFRGGLETGVKKIRMPKPKLLFGDAQTLASQNTQLFTQDTRIVFKPGGHYTWQTLSDGAINEQQGSIGDEPVYLMATAGTTLYVSGTVNGKVLVYSPRRIVIEGNLVYRSQQDDLLGLVSGRDVVIADQETTGDGGLTIHGSIYAGRRFTVRDYSSDHAGTLTIVGSLSAGTLTATEPRYATRIVFDKRFETLRPPGFPVTDSFELTSLDLDWLATPLEN